MGFDSSLWQRTSAASVADVMGGRNVMEYTLHALRPDAFAAGPAFTVQILNDDVSFIFNAIREAEPGSVLVIAGVSVKYACAGEIMAAAAEKKGISAIVTEGCVRDSEAIRKMSMPVFCRGTIPCTSRITVKGGKTQVPVTCGGVTVMPGDIVVADDDGVVVIPQAEAEEIRQKALAKEQRDAARKLELLGKME
jgi:4-hydroxy-4-methyl-2-oxoglutarate aldolase